MISSSIFKTKCLNGAKIIGAAKSTIISHPVLVICGGIIIKVCLSYAGYRFLKRVSERDKNRIIVGKCKVSD